MDLDLEKYAVRAIVGLAVGAVFWWQYSQRKRRAGMSIRPRKKP